MYWVGGGGCIWIIASALWSRVFRIRLVNELKCIRPDLDLDQELDNIYVTQQSYSITFANSLNSTFCFKLNLLFQLFRSML